MTTTHPIYLDYAAATPLDPTVLLAMQPYYSEMFFNPSASYSSALKTKQALSQARKRLAYWLGAKEAEIIFTAGATEANNLAVQGVMQLYPDSNIVVSSIEHESVLAPASSYDVRLVNIHSDGRLDLDDLEQKIDNNTVLVSIMLANNEIGTIEPLKEAAKIITHRRRSRENKLPLYLHSDAAQAANYLDLHAARLGVDMMSINGGKIYGPKQSGALYIKTGVILKPIIQGGGQERNLRSGTENVVGSIGLAAALDKAQTIRHEETYRLKILQQKLIGLLEDNIEALTINGSLKQRLPNNVHFSLTGKDNERLLFELDELGIMAAAGSACSASSDEPSHVLAALGKSLAEAQSSIRLTLGRQTTIEDITFTARTIASLAKP
jgi:cysteine desulfurase